MSNTIRLYRGKESIYDGTQYREATDKDIYYKTTEGVKHFFNLSCDRAYFGKHVFYSEGVYAFENCDMDNADFTYIWAPSPDYVKVKTGTYNVKFNQVGIRERIRLRMLYNWPKTLSLWIPSNSWAEDCVLWNKQLKNIVRLASEHGIRVMVHTTDLHQDILIRPCALYGDTVVTINNHEQYQDDTSRLNIRYDVTDFAWRSLSKDQITFVYTWSDAFGIVFDPQDNKSMQLAYNTLSWYQYLNVEWDNHFTVCPECGHPVSTEAIACGFCYLRLPYGHDWCSYEEYLREEAEDNWHFIDADYDDESND